VLQFLEYCSEIFQSGTLFLTLLSAISRVIEVAKAMVDFTSESARSIEAKVAVVSISDEDEEISLLQDFDSNKHEKQNQIGVSSVIIIKKMKDIAQKIIKYSGYSGNLPDGFPACRAKEGEVLRSFPTCEIKIFSLAFNL
jgi:hypothetical protein